MREIILIITVENEDNISPSHIGVKRGEYELLKTILSIYQVPDEFMRKMSRQQQGRPCPPWLKDHYGLPDLFLW